MCVGVGWGVWCWYGAERMQESKRCWCGGERMQESKRVDGFNVLQAWLNTAVLHETKC